MMNHECCTWVTRCLGGVPSLAVGSAAGHGFRALACAGFGCEVRTKKWKPFHSMYPAVQATSSLRPHCPEWRSGGLTSQ